MMPQIFRKIDFGAAGVAYCPWPLHSGEVEKSAADSLPHDPNHVFDGLWPFARPQQVEKTADYAPDDCLDGHVVGPLEAFYGGRIDR
jgi:hypothetical protein